ncbi:MAG: hypothetical protein QOH61_1467 [Chloroflexota bacterium]|nr:hypothetical protein [Chloroflexota bacterium]
MTAGGRILAARGVRSEEGRGVRSALGASLDVVLRDPGLWLLGALSFSVRGGVILVLLPIVWIPSPVLLSVFFGRYITTSGLSADVIPVAALAGAVAVLALAGAAVLAAHADLASFERLVTGGSTAGLRGERPARPLGGRERHRMVAGLAALNLLGLLPILLLTAPLGQGIAKAGIAELQYPTSLDTPFVLTVLGHVTDQLLVLAAVALLADLVVTLIGHQLLASHFRVLPDGLVPTDGAGAGSADRPHPDRWAVVQAVTRLVTQAPRTLALAALCWVVTIAALVPILLGIILGWDTLRAVLFRGTSGVVSPELQLVGQLLALVVFGVIWVAAVTLAGFASSLRGAIWTTNTLH